MSPLTDIFFDLHVPGEPFVLENAWDAASAAVFESEGAVAIGTSSAGMAWALGYPDGEHIEPDELFDAIHRIVRVTHVPVSADIEAGYGSSPGAVVHSVERTIHAGAVGANLEDFDSQSGDLIPTEMFMERIRAVKARTEALGLRFFINARTDILLRDLGPEETRVDRTIERLRAYSAAGADGVFAPGTSDPRIIERIASSVDKPLNVLAGEDTPRMHELGALGVARVSVGSSPMQRTLGVVRDIARELKRGTFAYARQSSIEYAELNAMFRQG
jgi:2-methylisocitrate lyase-like PEP mutase family enzyme